MPIIRFDTVTKQFTPESYGIQEVSFVVEPGELIFITGPSGSGKTTLMRLMTREYTPSGGEIFFRDEPISIYNQRNVHHHRRRIGVVFQDYRLIPDMNVWENIALPLYVSGSKDTEVEQRVTDLLNLIKLADKAELFPSQLSGGEAQRVSIARALAVGPEVIFADEPTGNLDPTTAQHIAKLLRKINELGTTVFVATHDFDLLAEHKDVRRLELEDGKITRDNAKQSTKSIEKKSTEKEADSKKSKESIENIESEATKEYGSEPKITPAAKQPSFLQRLFSRNKTKIDSGVSNETENLDSDPKNDESLDEIASQNIDAQTDLTPEKKTEDKGENHSDQKKIPVKSKSTKSKKTK